MKVFLSITLLFSLSFSSHGQFVFPDIITNVLPNEILESSGLEINVDHTLWTHNDSGDGPYLYLTDTLGQLLKTVYVNVDSMIDFEDLAQDHLGNLYIGEFGNNGSTRQDLKVYKISAASLIAKDTVSPEIINFSFPDQTAFPPSADSKNFDCEAMIHFNGKLYLFSKNHGTSTYTRRYSLPDMAGTHQATLIDSFDTGGWILSADINDNGNRLVLTGDTYFWFFYNFTGDDFFSRKSTMGEYPLRQHEAVVFKNDNEIYLTEDPDGLHRTSLFLIDLNEFVGIYDIDIYYTIRVIHDPSSQKIIIKNGDDPLLLEAALFDIKGQQVLPIKKSAASIIELSTAILSQGIYILQLSTKGFKSITKKISVIR